MQNYSVRLAVGGFFFSGLNFTVGTNFTQEVIPTFDMAANEIFFDRYPDSILEHQIQVRPYNALKTRNMRSLNPEGKLVNCRVRKQPEEFTQVY